MADAACYICVHVDFCDTWDPDDTEPLGRSITDGTFGQVSGEGYLQAVLLKWCLKNASQYRISVQAEYSHKCIKPCIKKKFCQRSFVIRIFNFQAIMHI